MFLCSSPIRSVNGCVAISMLAALVLELLLISLHRLKLILGKNWARFPLPPPISSYLNTVSAKQNFAIATILPSCQNFGRLLLNLIIDFQECCDHYPKPHFECRSWDSKYWDLLLSLYANTFTDHIILTHGRVNWIIPDYRRRYPKPSEGTDNLTDQGSTWSWK